MKNLHKISIIILSLGWFPYMWLVAFGMHYDGFIRILILCTGLMLCVVGSIISLGLSSNNEYWMNLEEIQKYKKRHAESIKEYENAKNLLINKVLELGDSKK